MTAVRICAASEIELTSAVRVVIDDQPIALVKDSAGEIFAIGDTCTHGDISLSEGFVEDDTIECWAHGSQFSLRTGKALTLPITNEENGQTENVSTWGVRVPESTYRSVEADKRDDGIVQRNVLGLKEYGFLDVDYVMPVQGGAVTRW